MSSSTTPLFCPDDGVVLHEARRGVFTCHCRGTLLVRDVFHRDAPRAARAGVQADEVANALVTPINRMS